MNRKRTTSQRVCHSILAALTAAHERSCMQPRLSPAIDWQAAANLLLPHLHLMLRQDKARGPFFQDVDFGREGIAVSFK